MYNYFRSFIHPYQDSGLAISSTNQEEENHVSYIGQFKELISNHGLYKFCLSIYLKTKEKRD